MATLIHLPHVTVITPFRAQVASRALVLLAVSAVTWSLPSSRSGTVDTPSRWLGSSLSDATLIALVMVLAAVAAVAYVWQRRRPADMGALAWVVAGGVLTFVSLLLIFVVGNDAGPVYWWLGAGVVVTSMSAQVLAALAGHAAAVLQSRR